MKIVETSRVWRGIRKLLGFQNVGFVPTMGALHEGHLSLVKKAKSENDIVLVSIFVNPTQFNDPKDLEKYPRTLDKDSKLLESVGCDYLFYPKYDDLYRDAYRYKITENENSKILCGAHRPGHFDGVLTVVLKLLNISGAQKAYFGEKDYQQLQLIKDMSDSFFLPIEIIGCPTMREKDGLAMSSRNLLLSEQERSLAPELAKALKSKSSLDEIKWQLESKGFKVDYVEEHWGRRFGAVHLGNVRLIDNVEI